MPNWFFEKTKTTKMKKRSMSELEFAQTVFKNGLFLESPLNSVSFMAESATEESKVDEKHGCFSFMGSIYLISFSVSYGEPSKSCNPSNGYCKETKIISGITRIILP